MEELPMRPISVKSLLGLALLAVPLSARYAHAVDHLIPGQMHMVERGFARMMAKPTGGSFAAPTGDPTLEGGRLQIVDVGGGSPPMLITLPASGWRRQGRSNGKRKKREPSSYRYQGAGTPDDPCTLVTVSPSEIKFVCTGAGV